MKVSWFLLSIFLLLTACGGSGDSSGGTSGNGGAPSPVVTAEPSIMPTIIPTPSPVPTATPVAVVLHLLVDDPRAQDAIDLLNQASFGATQESISEVMNSSSSAWIDRQMSLPLNKQLPLVDQRVSASGLDPFDKSNDGHAYLKELHRSDIWWDAAINGEDQLRLRVAFALSQIFVISNVSDTLFHDIRGIADYHDVLAEHAFGNCFG